ncbi:MAG TPA: hypothetical protein IAD08_04885 [Candidatus Scatovivens faecipullorum]|nr:hypothetical protein [Candidatus Scatovivens faecipullorum]
MDFEDFEGFKRIKNNKNLNIKDVFELLEKYQEEIGELRFDLNSEQSNIIADIRGKYLIRISIRADEIILERELEENHIEDDILKVDSAIDLARTDRMIEQIYDLLRDYIKNGTITEHITSVKRVLYMKEDVKRALANLIVVGKLFEFSDTTSKIVYEARENPLMNEFIFKNCKEKREAWTLKYSDYRNDKYTFLKQPFEKIEIARNKDEVKNIFEGKINKKDLKIAADYSDNHYLIELDEIVIGSIDCMDPLVRREYRLEVNNLNYEYLVVMIAVMIDIFLGKEYLDNSTAIENVKDDIENTLTEFKENIEDFNKNNYNN